jgi:hypothetical protein
VNVGRSTVQLLERGTREYVKVSATHRAVARAVGWDEGSVEAVLAGRPPTLVTADTNRPDVDLPSIEEPDALPEGMSERAKRALLGGQAMDTDVIGMSPDDPERGEVVLVYKKPTRQLTPDEMRDDMRRWARMQALLRDIVISDSDEGKKSLPPG